MPVTGPNAPPTPPLSESDAQHSRSGQIASAANSSNSLGDVTPTIYSHAFPTISNLAIQNRLADLIDLAETTEVTASTQSRVDQSRLLLVAPLVLSCVMINDLAPAHIALKRLPDHLSRHTLAQSLFKLVAAALYRNYRLIYKNADDLLALVQGGTFFSTSLASVIKLLVERYIQDLRRKTTELLSKAYTALPIALASTYFGVPEDDTRRSLEAFGWSFDPAAKELHPPAANRPLPNSPSPSTLSTVRQMIGGAAQVESNI